MITVIGGSSSQKKRVRSMVEFCADSLMPRLKHKLDIRVELKTSNGGLGENLGTCIWEDTNDRPRSFVIEASSSVNMRTLLITVAHEMVHVKQFARNEQKHMLMVNKVKWMGKTVNTDKVNYWELPWEIEANGRETGLFINWCVANKVEHQHWTLDKNEL